MVVRWWWTTISSPPPPLPDSLYVYEFFSTRVAGADAGALSSAAGRA